MLIDKKRDSNFFRQKNDKENFQKLSKILFFAPNRKELQQTNVFSSFWTLVLMKSRQNWRIFPCFELNFKLFLIVELLTVFRCFWSLTLLENAKIPNRQIGINCQALNRDPLRCVAIKNIANSQFLRSSNVIKRRRRKKRQISWNVNSALKS